VESRSAGRDRLRVVGFLDVPLDGDALESESGGDAVAEPPQKLVRPMGALGGARKIVDSAERRLAAAGSHTGDDTKPGLNLLLIVQREA
jgi:hypothetical protein